MRKLAGIGVALALASCGQRTPDGSSSAETADTAGVSVTAAPGVDFNYRYAFRLPNARIAAVQEEHAQACERLGISRCRITGMRYRVIDEDNVSAMLALKLEPSLARTFGKDAAAAVRRSEGMLIDTEISGVDVSPRLSRTSKEIAEGRAELARLEAQLSRGDLRPADRARIEAHAAELRRQGRALVPNAAMRSAVSPRRRWCSIMMRVAASPASKALR